MKRNDPNFRKPIQKHSKPVHSLNVHFVNLFSPSVRSPILPSVRPVHLCPPVLSVHLLCPSVRPSGNSLHSIRPLCTVRSFAQFVCPSVHLFVCPSALSINPDRPVWLSVQSFHLFIRRPFVRPVCLSVQSVCPSTLRMATRTAKNQYVKISKTAVLHVHRAFRIFLCRWCTTSTWNFHIPCIFHFTYQLRTWTQDNDFPFLFLNSDKVFYN